MAEMTSYDTHFGFPGCAGRGFTLGPTRIFDRSIIGIRWVGCLASRDSVCAWIFSSKLRVKAMRMLPKSVTLVFALCSFGIASALAAEKWFIPISSCFHKFIDQLDADQRNALRIILFITLLCALAGMNIANGRLIKSRTGRRSLFSPLLIIDDMKRKEFYVFLASVILVLVIGGLLALL